MKHFLRIAALLALFAFPAGAEAATCFWVGTGGVASGGTFSLTNGVNWASSSNGANSTCAATGGVPKNTGDIATFDNAANGLGSGTVTLDSSLAGMTIATINFSTVTGGATLVNAQNFTLTTAFNTSGSGARTINNSGTITFTSAAGFFWDASTSTNLTCTCTTGAFISSPGIANSGASFGGGGIATYGTLTFNSRTNGTEGAVAGANTFVNLNINGPIRLVAPASTTTTVTGALNITGTSTGLVELQSSSTNALSPATLALSGASISATWAALKGLTLTGGSITGSGSAPIFDVGGNTGVTGAAPASGGGGRIIGG